MTGVERLSAIPLSVGLEAAHPDIASRIRDTMEDRLAVSA
jgi:hypothetical protein